MVAELINKYTWIIQTLLRYGDIGLSLEEIQEKWESRWGEPYSRKTFHNHRIAINEIFNIDITCDRSTNHYYIQHADDVSDETANSQWLINTFTVNSLLEMGKERLSGRIAVEDIPSGQKYLTSIMDAMLGNQVLQISYHKYTQATPNTYHIHPYALKEFMKRWYLIGYCQERRGIRVYGLDRICEINGTEEEFVFPEHFDVNDYFSDSFGVFRDEKMKAEEIWFATTEVEANFLNDLPIHHSQRRVKEIPQEFLPLPADMTAVYKINIVPDYSLEQEFCRHMDKVKILAPASFRKKVTDTLQRMMDLYE